MELNSNYMENHLIAYIGNKRRLLPLIKKSIEKTEINKKGSVSFLDLFAGSGSVSRLAKNMGFEVYTNDWEYYSFVLNKSFLELDNNFLEESFKKLGGVDNAIDILNNLPNPKKDEEYIAKYYCPDNDKTPDTNNERMFYTNYNGKKIDAIRNQIEKWSKDKLIDKDEELFLLSLLLYEASTRSNTSGVFKGFHNGFGGSNGDALTRILKPIKLVKPQLIDGKQCFVTQENALSLVENSDKHYDICYIDPPYNQHQYGSNYHLLNTIALNDKPEVNKNIFIDQKKVNKSAIRRDWIKTKSSFCYKKSAKEDFEKIISNIKADHILISYSTDGIITLDEMLDILSKRGKLNIVISEYVKFRGGKQSLTAEVRNIEFVLLVDTKVKGNKDDIDRIHKELLINKMNLISKKTINPLRAETVGYQFKKVIVKKYDIENVIYKIYDNNCIEFRIEQNKICFLEDYQKIINNLNIKLLKEIYNDFEYMTNMTKEDELYLVINEIVKNFVENNYSKSVKLFEQIPYLLSKFNNKKAYLQSLKAILTILNTINHTIDIWRNVDFLYNAHFQKFEKIIFLKLACFVNSSEVIELKKQIGECYDEVIEKLSVKKSYEKAGDIKNNSKKVLLNR